MQTFIKSFIILTVLVATTTTALALPKEGRVIEAINVWENGDRSPKQPPVVDYYIDLGRKDGIKKDLLFQVFRPLIISDSYAIRALVGKVKVVIVYDDISIVRVHSLEPVVSRPLLDYDVVMIGDYVKLAPLPIKKPAPIKRNIPSSKTSFKTPVMVLLSNVLFDVDSSKIKPQAANALLKLFDLIQSQNEIILIEGHTSNTGTKVHNIQLSQKRAKSVEIFLKKQNKVRNRIISIGLGMNKPVASNNSEEGRAKNRRVEFYLIPSGELSF